ncbi:hypothetical protein OQ279_09920 [Salinimicrobium sp. MT39]|uniref:Uncharacterized protein n=1 Tax=Salinimicrobium profundisediminis TaxID=2994553 RepID=A0A9X3CZY0_9FLAO|nr:hypothetical protein [Salinimicrobium profundisediminis]MCX2838470.1 hypothetical protein [Salinimicrobium profundisediminis]
MTFFQSKESRRDSIFIDDEHRPFDPDGGRTNITVGPVYSEIINSRKFAIVFQNFGCPYTLINNGSISPESEVQFLLGKITENFQGNTF